MLTHNLLFLRMWDQERVGDGWLLRDVMKWLRRKLGNTTRTPGTYSRSRGSGTGGCRGGGGVNARTSR